MSRGSSRSMRMHTFSPASGLNTVVRSPVSENGGNCRSAYGSRFVVIMGRRHKRGRGGLTRAGFKKPERGAEPSETASGTTRGQRVLPEGSRAGGREQPGTGKRVSCRCVNSPLSGFRSSLFGLQLIGSKELPTLRFNQPNKYFAPMQPTTARTEPPPISLTLPRAVPPARIRAPKKNVPQTSIERTRILHLIRAYVAEFNPVPPQPLDQLREHTERFISLHGSEPIYRDYCGVLLNNEMWREHLAAVPYERRLLLLPKCLRVESKCPAPFDEFGLLCKQCGLCSIQDLQLEAERLGYAVLVAGGSSIVMSLIQTGKIEAIVGVSCLSVLERAFPYMEAAAIPGVAIPLLQDDCIDTTVDLDWIWDYIHLTGDDQTRRLDLGQLREEVDFWFTPLNLDAIMGPAKGATEKIAREWLCRAGKRWRPFLTVSAYQALRATPGASLPEDLRKIAVAVECFHKASLIHDDIEDNDTMRYGEKTLHEEHGVAVALNAGDLLIGEGYRLLAACQASAEQKAAMLLIASQGQRQLCRGQGAELCWTRHPGPLTTLQVLDI